MSHKAAITMFAVQLDAARQLDGPGAAAQL